MQTLKMSELEFFERQSDDSKDCSVFSLNNALGFHALDPETVVQNIDERLEKFARYMGMSTDDPKLQEYRKRMTTDNTFFSANAVWNAAVELGIIEKPRPISGFGGNYAHVKPEMMDMSFVILGVRKDKAYHAVGVRGGMIYDSLNHGPAVPLTDDNLALVYKKVFAAFKIDRKK
jgi:hypothetical protein